MSSTSNRKTIVILGALDTKDAEFAFIKDLIEKEEIDTLVVDFGTMGEPGFKPDIARVEVAVAGGGDLAYLELGEHKDEAMEIMAEGAAVVVRRLYDEGELGGIISMGGSALEAPPSPPLQCGSCRWACPR